jgi:hypothetical protein
VVSVAGRDATAHSAHGRHTGQDLQTALARLRLAGSVQMWPVLATVAGSAHKPATAMRQGITGGIRGISGVTAASSRRMRRRSLRMAVLAVIWHVRPQYFGFRACDETVKTWPQTSHVTGGGGPSCHMAGHAVRLRLAAAAAGHDRSCVHSPPSSMRVQWTHTRSIASVS